ncbi:MAG: UDP-N-acetylmuramoyl-tripeptide--D-alanyl-D-alanine ligase [Bacillota bacterium]|nr:MAG: UDP-N-acetylmuramoyl-tripeptide--D-alanyl-D-alanine ligase [Bacillota bacterium]MBS3950195.1 UDP-N-acetylmuramoyl-tripeptide--D-alanyl-D-alanine ligase [Peptococcaceae bacterium]
MYFRTNDLYPPTLVSGPYSRGFSDIIVGGDKATPDSLFVHAEGTYMESEEKMLNAYYQGCRIFIASRFSEVLINDASATLVTMSDPVQELYRLARMIRGRSQAQIIGITGSMGKTTTKDMTAHILRAKYKNTLKTYRNYNGALGVSLTLRKLQSDDQFAVVEIGLGEAGSVGRGAELAQPHIGVLINVGVSHIAKFGSIESIAHEKGQLLQYLPPNGTVIANGDDAWCRRLTNGLIRPTLSFGLKKHNALRAYDIRQLSPDILEFNATYGMKTQRFSLQTVGRFQTYNALAAIAVGLTYGFELEEMAVRLSGFKLSEQRLKPLKLKNFTLLDDGYNSNPRALTAALTALVDLPLYKSNRVAVIGDMQYLGRFTQLYYKKLCTELKALNLDHVVLIGPAISQLAPSLSNATVAHSATQAAEQALAAVEPGGALLLKGHNDPLFREMRKEIERLEGERNV